MESEGANRWPRKPAAPLIAAARSRTSLALSNVTKAWRRVLNVTQAKLPGFHLFELRHTFATELLAQGAPVTYVAAQLGHTEPTTTLQWYAHWLPTSRRNYVDALDAREQPSEPVAEAAEAARRAPVQSDMAPIGHPSPRGRRIPRWKCGKRLAPRAGLEPATS